MLTVPAAARAHGAIDPEASVDLARITHVPGGLRVRMVDGDLRLWMSVPAATPVTVLDDQGGRYLRFTARGVYANQSSPMFYLDLNPPVTPSLTLTRRTAPSWHLVTRGHSYMWHDGRIAALADDLSPPGARVLGRWAVPLLVDGRAETIGGVLVHRPRPSLAWLWPSVVALLVLPAVLRRRDSLLDRRLARRVSAVTLLGVLAAALGAGLHGRPGLSATLLVPMAVELGFVAWAAVRLARRQGDLLTMALVAALALDRAVAGIAVLWRGYVLLAIPAPLARSAISACLAGGIYLAVEVLVLVDRLRPGVGRGAATG